MPAAPSPLGWVGALGEDSLADFERQVAAITAAAAAVALALALALTAV